MKKNKSVFLWNLYKTDRYREREISILRTEPSAKYHGVRYFGIYCCITACIWDRPWRNGTVLIHLTHNKNKIFYYTSWDWHDDYWNIIGWTDHVIGETKFHVSHPRCASERRVLHPSGGLSILLARVIALCCHLQSSVNKWLLSRFQIRIEKERCHYSVRQGPQNFTGHSVWHSCKMYRTGHYFTGPNDNAFKTYK
jgi:hypothetical protein